jgi:hypothetical protein
MHGVAPRPIVRHPVSHVAVGALSHRCNDPTEKKTSTLSLEHGTVIRFDAIKHKSKKCEHRVAKTLNPRVNVTLRLIKKPK